MEHTEDVKSHAGAPSALNVGLGHVSIEDKAAAFDALVREFQGKARLVHRKRRTKEVKTGPGAHEVSIVHEDYPVYEFVLRVDGHDDFAAAILALLKRPNVRISRPCKDCECTDGQKNT